MAKKKIKACSLCFHYIEENNLMKGKKVVTVGEVKFVYESDCQVCYSDKKHDVKIRKPFWVRDYDKMNKLDKVLEIMERKNG